MKHLITPQLADELKREGLADLAKQTWVDIDEAAFTKWSPIIDEHHGNLTPEERHAMKVIFCLTHPDHKQEQPESGAVAPEQKFLYEVPKVQVEGMPELLKEMRRVWIALLLLAFLLLVFSVRAHAQYDPTASRISVITIQNNDGSNAGIVASPFTLKVGSNCSWAKSGTTYTINCTGGAAGAGGSNTQVQYNNAGALGGITNVLSDGTNFTKMTVTGPIDLTGSSVLKLRLAAGLTTATNGEIGYDTTANRWKLWTNGADRKLIPSTNDGGAGQVLASNADGTGTFVDPIVSPNQDAASTAAWTSGTAQNTAVTIAVSQRSTATVSFNGSSITGGVITFEVSPDNSTWYPVTAIRDDISAAEGTYTLTGSNRTWTVAVGGFTNFRVRLSTVITGAGTANVAVIAQALGSPNRAATIISNIPHVIVDTAPTTAVTGPLTDTQLRATPVQVQSNSANIATETTIAAMSGKLPAALDGSGFLKTHEQGTAAVSEADGADTTLGAKADAKSAATDTTAITAMQVLKELSFLLQNKLLVTPDSVALPANQSVNVAQVAGSNTSTSATGVQKVGVVGSAGAAVDGTTAAGTAPTNGFGILGVFTTTLPSLSTNQSAAVPTDPHARPYVVPVADTNTASYHASVKFAASSTTDNAVMPGNATNTVLLTRITVTCTETTAGQINIELLKRSTADSAGTAANMTVIPDDANYAAAVSVPKSYTGTGPTVGTPIGDLDNAQIGCMAAATATPNDVYVFKPSKPIVLRGTAQMVAINVGNAALTGGTLTVTFDFIETTTP